jgi:hypothetical protein
MAGAVSVGNGNGVGEPSRVTGTGPPKGGSTSAGTQATANQSTNVMIMEKEGANDEPRIDFIGIF